MILLVLFLFTIFLEHVECKLPTIRDNMAFYNGFAPQTDDRRLLRIMNEPNYQRHEVFALDAISSKLKSFDYLTLAVNIVLQANYKVTDYIFLPNMTGIFLATNDATNLGLFLADIRENNFDKGTLQLGTISAFKSSKLVPFYPLMEDTIATPNCFILYNETFLSIYDSQINLKSIISGSFIAVCTIPERNMFMAVAQTGELKIWTYSLSKPDKFAIFTYNNFLVNTSSKVFLQRMNGNSDVFVTLTNGSNILRMWSVNQKNNFNNVTLNIFPTGFISVNATLLLVFNAHEISYLSFDSSYSGFQTTDFNFTSIDIQDVIAEPDRSGVNYVTFLTTSGVLLHFTVNFTDSNTYVGVGQNDLMTPFVGKDSFLFQSYTIDDGQGTNTFLRSYVAATVSQDLKSLIYYPFPPKAGEFYYANQTRNIYTVSLLLQVSGASDSTNIVVNTQGAASVYNFDTTLISNENTLVQDILVAGSATMQGSVTLYSSSTSDAQTFLTISTSTNNLYIYDALDTTGNNIKSVNTVEGEIYRFCERNDFTSLVYFYLDDVTGLYKIGRKSVDSTLFTTSDHPFGNDLDTMTFTKVYSCVNSRGLSDQYFFLVFNDTTERPNILQYTGTGYNIIAGNDLWASSVDDGIVYIKRDSGFVSLLSSIDLSLYYGEKIKIMKLDSTTIFAFGVYETYAKFVNSSCNIPTVSAVESVLCYADTYDCSGLVAEFQDYLVCSSFTTCPTGTFQISFTTNDYNPSVNIDICRNSSFNIEYCYISTVSNGLVVCSQCLPSYYLLSVTTGGQTAALYCVDPTNDPRLAINGSQPSDGTGVASFCSNLIPNCLECNGATDNCSICFPNYELLPGSNGKYTCTNCSNNLNNCVSVYCDSTTKRCAQCAANYFLYNSLCVSSCTSPALFTNETSSTGLGHCFECSSIPHCTSCSSSGCSQCEGGYFLNSTGVGICQLCSSALNKCLNCSDSATCTNCEPLYIINSGKCVPDCKGNCLAGCNTCEGLNCDLCLSCPTSKFLYQQSCLIQCPFGYYSYNDSLGQVCAVCNPSCRSCSGPLSTNCLSCNIPQYLFNNTCVDTCPTRLHYADLVNYICPPCHQTCLRCTGPNDTQCTSCLTPQYQYFTDGKCTKCKVGCDTCNDTTPSNCTKCSSGYYLFISDCLLECPPGYFATQGLCTACDDSCLTCNGLSALNCTSCETPYNLNEGSCALSKEQVVPDKYPPNTYPAALFSDWGVQTSDPASLVVTCDNGNNIMGGVSSFPPEISSVYSFLSDPPIFELTVNFTFYKIDTWAAGTWLNVAINGSLIFTKTYTNEGTANLCTSGSTAQNDLSENISLIVDVEWPVVNLSIGVNGTVLWGIRALKVSLNKCDGSCLTCSGYLDNQCLTCYPLAFLSQGTCACLPGFYQKINKTCLNFPCSSCEVCNTLCSTCNGPTSQNCTSCSERYNLINSTCVISDRKIAVTNDLTVGSLSSIVNWIVKTGPGSRRLLQSTPTTVVSGCNGDPTMLGGKGVFNSTTQVSKNFTLSDSSYSVTFKARLFKFYAINPVNIIVFTFDNNTFEVAPSDFTFTSYGYCSTSSRNDTSMTSYKDVEFTFTHNTPDLTLTINTTIINPYSDESWGINNIQIVQLLCDASCFSCTGPYNTDCEKCAAKYYADPSTGLCVTNCSDGYYGDVESGQCLNCDPSCQMCDGPEYVNCLYCFTGTYLLNNECYDSCLDGTYPDKSLNGTEICLICDTSCDTCDGGSNASCLTCPGDAPVYYSNKQCLPCNEKCLTCSDSSPNNCTQCSANYTLLFGKTCTDQVPIGYYSEILENGRVFLKCDPSCQNCSNATRHDCTSCSNGQLLAATGECLESCTNGTFWNAGDKACSPCDDSCKECTGGTPTDCTNCSYGLYLIPETKTCVKSKEMTVKSVVIDNPTNFGLVFSEYWQDLMSSISKYIIVTISSLEDTDFTYKVIQSPENNLMAEVIIDYQKNISKGSEVYITLSSASDLKSSQLYYREFTENQTLTEMKICPSGSFFNNVSQTCTTKSSDRITSITLRKSSSPSRFTLYLTNSNSDLLKMALKTTTVQFTGYFQDVDYTYSFESTSSDPSQITILMNYIRSMSTPQIRVNIELPSNFIQNYPNDIFIIDNQMALNDITVLSDTQKSLSESTKSVTEATRLITIISILISSAFAKSFGAVQTLMLINLVFYLKYINIDYPPHMQDLFDSEDFALPFLIFNYNNPNQLILPPPDLITPEYYTDIKSGEDVWLKYKVKLYFLDNFGDKLVQFVIVFIFALIIYKLKHFIVNPKINNIVTKIFDFLCWGWILNFFLTNFRNIFIYVFRVWHYCKMETAFSKFDLFISILVFLVMIISTIHIWNVNWVIRRETIKKKKMEKEKENEKKQIEAQISEETKIKLKFGDEHDQGGLMSPSKSPHGVKNEPAGMSCTLKTGELIQNEKSEVIPPKSELKQAEKINEKTEDKNEKSAFLTEKNSEMPIPQTKKKGGFMRSKQSRALDAWALIYTPDELYEKKYIVMNNDYDKKHKKTINYVVLFLLRYFGYSFIIVVMNNIPFLQVFLIQYINVIFFIYLVKCRPFESKIKFGFAVIQEIIVIYLYFYPLVLAGYQLTGRIFDEDKMKIGDYFLKSYMAFTIVIMVTVILGIIVTVIENKKKKKLEEAKKKEEEAKKKKEEEDKKKEEDKNKEGDKKEGEEEKKKEEDHKEEKKKKTDKKKDKKTPIKK